MELIQECLRDISTSQNIDQCITDCFKRLQCQVNF